MSPRVRAVFFKELRDALRDRRTIFASVVVPILLYPIMMLGLAEVAQQAKARIEKEIYEVAVPEGTTSFMLDLLKLPDLEAEAAQKQPPKIEDKPGELKDPGEIQKLQQQVAPVGPAPAKEPSLIFREMTAEDAAKALKAGTIRASVVLPPDIDQRIAAQQKVDVQIRYDRAERRSQETLTRLQTLFKRYELAKLRERLSDKKLSTDFIKPLTLSSENVAEAVKVSGSIIGSFLPLLFIMMIITGAINPAIDMTAGEKERFTLETLIGMPIRPVELIAGKFLAVSALALGNAALNVASFGLTFSVVPMPQGGAFEFPWFALPATLLLLAPLTLFFAGLLLAVSSLAANVKEAQIYCLPVYLVPVLGLMVVMMPGIELEGPLLLAPVLNTALLIKELFLGRGTAMQMTYVFCSTCMYAAGTVAFAARVFAREDVLFSSQGSFRVFLKRKFFIPSPVPRAGDSLLLLALMFPLFFYVQTGLTKLLVDFQQGIKPLELILMVVIPQWGLFLGIPILLTWYLKVNPKTTFQWRMPSARAIGGAIFLAVGAWPIVSQLISWQSYVWPIAQDEFMHKALKDILTAKWGTAILLFLMAVTPAICEEHLFRGFLQQGLVKSGKWTALIVVGVIFGAYHLPLFKQPIIMTMGVIIAYVAYESRSIWPGVLMHFIYNGLGVIGPNISGVDESKWKSGEPLPGVELQYLIPAIVIFIAGLLLVRRSAPAQADAKPPVAPIVRVEAPAQAQRVAATVSEPHA
ncbi:MAG TPA: ABC transporter permease subunit/CPBP intramembrane protease [Planctomycetota bacterium]|nr:ABC transporter permease subunit/CPBP intramembrane protease [Planctomycetota bacterium]